MYDSNFYLSAAVSCQTQLTAKYSDIFHLYARAFCGSRGNRRVLQKQKDPLFASPVGFCLQSPPTHGVMMSDTQQRHAQTRTKT